MRHIVISSRAERFNALKGPMKSVPILQMREWDEEDSEVYIQKYFKDDPTMSQRLITLIEENVQSLNIFSTYISSQTSLNPLKIH